MLQLMLMLTAPLGPWVDHSVARARRSHVSSSVSLVLFGKLVRQTGSVPKAALSYQTAHNSELQLRLCASRGDVPNASCCCCWHKALLTSSRWTLSYEHNSGLDYDAKLSKDPKCNAGKRSRLHPVTCNIRCQ